VTTESNGEPATDEEPRAVELTDREPAGA